MRELFPLSPVQAQVLSESLQFTEVDPYVIVYQTIFEEPTNIEALEQRCRQAFRVFPSLRSLFWQEDGAFFQAPSEDVSLDLSLCEVADDAEIFAHGEEARCYRFQLMGHSPLFRVVLYTRAGKAHGLCLICHHVVADAFGLITLTSYLRGSDPIVPSDWHNGAYARWLQQRDMSSATAFWAYYMREPERLGRMSMVKPLEQLPGRKGRRTFHVWSLDASVKRGLALWCERAKVSMATLYYGLWGYLVSRYSSTADVVFAVPRSCRHRHEPEIAQMVGICLNTIPLRLHVRGDDSLMHFLAEVQHNWRALYSVDQLSLIDIALSAGIGHMGELLSTTCNYLPLDRFSALSKRDKVTLVGEPTTPIALKILSVHGAVEFCLTYDPERVGEGAFQQFMGGFKALLGALGNLSEGARLWSLPAMSEEDQALCLRAWNDTQRDFGRLVRTEQMLGASVLQHGACTALSMEADSLTYGALGVRSDQLAWALMAAGVGVEDIVVVCLPRSFEMVISIYAVHKAGAAYLPLALDTPSARLLQILEDAAPKAVICDIGMASSFGGFQVISPDACGAQPQPMPVVSVDQCAYVIYTSGSTGKPKGVTCTHRGLMNRAHYLQDLYEMAAEDRVLQKTAYTFDVSLSELFWPLFHGAQLVLAKPGGHGDPHYLADVMVREKVSVAHFVPSMLAPFLEALGETRLVDLKWVICIGEALHPQLVDAFYEKTCGQLMNFYGPTEAVIDVLHAPTKAGSASVSIGVPHGNCRAYVLDPYMRLQPIGVPGELYLAGPQLARGYLHRPALTARAFVPAPVELGEGGRLYRTGDLVYRGEDGQVYFMGRTDGQVKVRGFRIELGEIEAHLNAVVGVALAAVTLDAEQGSISAWLVAPESRRESIEQELAARLPRYMLPNTYNFLSEMPLSSSGKADRQALQALGQKHGPSLREPPETPMERVVAQLFKRFLRLEQISRNDHFFQLGGHSLIAVHISLALQEEVGCVVSPQVILGHPVLRDLAQHLDQQTLQSLEDTGLNPVRKRPAHIPSSVSQEWMWMLHQNEEKCNNYTIPYSFMLDGDFKAGAFERALALVGQRHEILRTTFYRHDGQVCQRVAGELDVSPIYQRGDTEDVAELWMEALSEPFQMDQPLWRFYIVELNSQLRYLFVMVHHIACDATGMDLFFDEIWQCYEAEITHQTLHLPSPVIQPADHAIWERDQLSSDRIEILERYWSQRLDGAHLHVRLPLNKPKPDQRTGAGSIMRHAFPAELHARIQQNAQAWGISPFSMLLTAWFLLLNRYSQQEDQVVSVTLSGREQGETQHLIAAMLKVIPVRYHLVGHQNFAQHCMSLHELLTQDRKHHDLSPYQLLNMLGDRVVQESSASPVLFDFKMADSGERQAGSLRIQPESRPTFSSKMDLAISLRFGSSDMDALLEYDVALFDAMTIQAMLISYEAFISRLLRFNQIPVDRVSQLARSQKAQLARWGAGPEVECDDQLFDLFERMVAEHPHEIALEDGSVRLTYQQLWSKVAQAGSRLEEHGVGPGQHVGVYCPWGSDRVMGLLAVLWAGAAYVPIDTEYPESRVQNMVEDARIQRVIVSPATTFPLVSCDSMPLSDEAMSGPIIPRRKVPTQAPAYISFTSGSTGRPKGAMVRQRACCNFAQYFSRLMTLKPGDRFLQLSSPGFDVFFAEWSGALITGATLVSVLRKRLIPGEELAQVLRSERISHMVVPPSVAAATPADDLVHLRYLVFGGEALSSGIAQAWLPGRQCFNGYGPTEVTVATHFQPISHKMEGALPIGKSIANARAYVLDAFGNAVSPGLAGELHLGGEGVSMGYIGRPALTAERFVPEPGHFGKTMYRTGDLVRFDHQGRLVFLGRADSQLKIRGFRIEPLEIARVLLQVPEVRNAVVTGVNVPSQGTILVAYVETEGTWDGTAARQFLAEKLPTYMLPSRIIPMDKFPLSPAGKIDVKRLPAPEVQRNLENPSLPTFMPAAQIQSMGRDKLTATVRAGWLEVLGHDEFDGQTPFFEVGGNSLQLVRLSKHLEQTLNTKVSVTFLFQYTTLEEQVKGLLGDCEAHEITHQDVLGSDEIAIIGMSGRFPGAADVDSLWRMIQAGGSGLSTFSNMEMVRAGVPADQLYDPHYVSVRGILDEPTYFDAAFFGISARSAEVMDPQQRIFLEESWNALEDAGYDPAQTNERIGVYAGAGFPSYFSYTSDNSVYVSEFLDKVLGNANDFLATRVGYRLGLRGPCITVQTACSTSLVAVETACRALQAGTCEVALAGGVSVAFPLNQGYLYEKHSILSKDGVCRPFDAEASGTVNSDGVGLVVLKPLDRALASGDTIHAVIKSAMVNNDGAARAGFTAPGVEGQRSAVASNLERAGLSGDQIGYVEAHGTATLLGDPIEVAALSEALGHSRQKRCALGSVKANIGHVNTAAGVTGLIKAALIVRDGVIPPVAHFQEANPKLNLNAGPFYVPTEATLWTDSVRYALVNSLGLGGTNANVIVSSPPKPSVSSKSSGPYHISLSAMSPEILPAMARNLAAHLSKHQEVSLADVMFTLHKGRKAMSHRAALTVDNREEAIASLGALAEQGYHTRALNQPKVVFAFPGLGGRLANMGASLYNGDSIYRQTIDACADRFRVHLGGDLRKLLYPKSDQVLPEGHGMSIWEMCAAFSIQLASAHMLRHHGIHPYQVVGLSLGEFAAACVADVLILDEAAELVYKRALLYATYAEGAMLLVGLAPEQVTPYLEKSLELSVYASPRLTGVAGSQEDIETLSKTLESQNIWCKRQRFDLAPHTSMLESGWSAMYTLAQSVPVRTPQLPYVSSFYGELLEDGQLLTAEYWANHLRYQSRMQQALEVALRDPEVVVIDLGPGHAASIFTEESAAFSAKTRVVSLYGSGHEQESHPWQFVGALWEAGLPIASWIPHEGRRISLPGYPFNRTSYVAPKRRQPSAADHEMVLYQQVWVPDIEQPVVSSEAAQWFIIPDVSELPTLLADVLRGVGEKVILCEDKQFQSYESRTLPANHPIHQALEATMPLKIVDFRYYEETYHPSSQDFDHHYRQLNDFLMCLRTIANHERSEPVEYSIVSSYGVQALPSEQIHPAKALADGPCLVGPQEISLLKTRRVDVGVAPPTLDTAQMLLTELRCAPRQPLVALREKRRLVPQYLPAQSTERPSYKLRKEAVCVITGGLGGLGLTLAEHLARDYSARLVLIGRRTWPPRSQWEDIVAEGLDDGRLMALERLMRLEKRGALLLLLSADVTDPDAMRQALATARKHFGGIHCVIHAAATVAQQEIQEVRPTTSEKILATKIQGAHILQEYTRQDDIDLFVLCSSLSGAVGGMRKSIYAASNAYVDLLAKKHAAEGVPMLSIGWEALDMGLTLRSSAEERRKERMLSEGEVKIWFERCLKQGSPHVIMSARGNPEYMSKFFLELASVTENEDAAATTIEDHVAAAWRAELGGPYPKEDDDFFRLGGSSLSAIGIVRRLRQSLDQTCSVYDLMETRKFGAFLVRVIARKDGGEAYRYRVVFQAGEPGETPLFLFPPAGGNLMCYTALPPHLDPRIPIYGIRQRGADGREPVDKDFEGMLQHYLTVVKRIQPKGPYRLAGSSMGGCLAYSLARRLKKMGEEVSFVCLIDTPGPGGVSQEALVKDGTFDLDTYLDAMSPDLLKKIKRIREGSQDGPFAKDLVCYRELFQTNVDLLANYTIEPYSGDVYYVRAKQRDPWNPQEPQQDWVEALGDQIHVADVDGNHITMMEEPYVEHLGSLLGQWLT